MNWLLIGVVVLAVVVAFIKISEMKHKLLFKALLIAGVFFIATLGYVYLSGHYNLTTYQGFLGLGQSYFSWLGGLMNNMGTVTGYAVQQDWGLNSTLNSTVVP